MTALKLKVIQSTDPKELERLTSEFLTNHHIVDVLTEVATVLGSPAMLYVFITYAEEIDEGAD